MFTEAIQAQELQRALMQKDNKLLKHANLSIPVRMIHREQWISKDLFKPGLLPAGLSSSQTHRHRHTHGHGHTVGWSAAASALAPCISTSKSCHIDGA